MKTFGKDHWSYKHGGATKTTKSGKSAEYQAYINAKSRCNNPKAVNYSYYGGRGIEFRFASFNEFFAELGQRPSPTHSVERINNDGHYESGNVRWATKKEQVENRRCTTLTVRGMTLPRAEWARRLGVGHVTLIQRQRQGWCDACIVTLPFRAGVKQSCLCLKNSTENE